MAIVDYDHALRRDTIFLLASALVLIGFIGVVGFVQPVDSSVGAQGNLVFEQAEPVVNSFFSSLFTSGLFFTLAGIFLVAITHVSPSKQQYVVQTLEPLYEYLLNRRSRGIDAQTLYQLVLAWGYDKEFVDLFFTFEQDEYLNLLASYIAQHRAAGYSFTQLQTAMQAQQIPQKHFELAWCASQFTSISPAV